MVVQQMVLFLRDAFDAFQNKFTGQGTANVPQAATSVGVTFSTTASLYALSVTPTNDPGGRYWVSGKSSLGFTINLQVAAPVGGINFDWLAKGA